MTPERRKITCPLLGGDVCVPLEECLEEIDRLKAQQGAFGEWMVERQSIKEENHKARALLRKILIQLFNEDLLREETRAFLDEEKS